MHRLISSSGVTSIIDALIPLEFVAWLRTIRPPEANDTHSGEEESRWVEGFPDVTKEVQNAMDSLDKAASV